MFFLFFSDIIILNYEANYIPNKTGKIKVKLYARNVILGTIEIFVYVFPGIENVCLPGGDGLYGRGNPSVLPAVH